MAQKSEATNSFANFLVNTKEELHQTLDTLLERVEWSYFSQLLKCIHNKVQGRKSYPALICYVLLLQISRGSL